MVLNLLFIAPTPHTGISVVTNGDVLAMISDNVVHQVGVTNSDKSVFSLMYNDPVENSTAVDLYSGSPLGYIGMYSSDCSLYTVLCQSHDPKGS